ncbi:hypothetical protein [Flavobacterium sp.]|uniref:hypothetical protein n=1 Tax=Flavobacterium sp. TaxID=239 RepID=UPI003750EF0B
MKNIKLIFSFVLLLAVTISCSIPDGIDQDTSFLSSAASANVSKVFNICTDNSGIVRISPTGEGVTSSKVIFGHGIGKDASAIVNPGSSASHTYPEGSYTVTIIYTDIAGNQTTSTYPLVVTFRAPENVVIKTSGEMKVSVSALYAKSFIVYYGDVANEVGTPLDLGKTLPAHTYPAPGSSPFVLKVVALSGGAATTTVNKTLYDLPIDFETPDVDIFAPFGSPISLFATVNNPNATGLNTSAKVGMFTKGGTTSGTLSAFNIPINFAYGKKIKVMVYNPTPANIGKNITLLLQAPVVAGQPAAGVAIKKVPITTSGAWEEIVFDYGTISAIPAGAKFGQLVMRFNDTQAGAQEVFYVDNFVQNN